MSGTRVERRLAAIPAVDAAGCSRLMDKDDAGTLARLAGVAHAMCDVSDELVDLGRICDASGLGIVIYVTALPLTPPASCINAEDPENPAIECLSPELALPITANGAIKRKAAARLVDAARKRVPITASGLPHF